MSAWRPPKETETPAASNTGSAVGRRRFSGLPSRAGAGTGEGRIPSEDKPAVPSRRFLARFFRYAVPAIHSGLKSKVTTRANPPTRSAQYPDRPNHDRKACGNRPSVAPIPAIIAPETMVTPPK